MTEFNQPEFNVAEYYVPFSVCEEAAFGWSRPGGRYLPDVMLDLTVSLRKLGQRKSLSGKSGIERLPGVDL
jgi:hypothetical protein